MNENTNSTSVKLNVAGPYDLSLSIECAKRFASHPQPTPSVYRRIVRIEGKPARITIRQTQTNPAVCEAKTDDSESEDRIRDIAQWVISSDLDLDPFYKKVKNDPPFKKIIPSLYGLKPFRPPSLFEMAVIAVTEQQISMEAAQKIRNRIIERFGEKFDQIFLFPTPESLAAAKTGDLKNCGLSTRKAEYIRGLAENIARGSVNLNDLKQMPDEEVILTVKQWRGFGRWSAEYILVRGLGRMDIVPADDLGIQKIAGQYLGNGERMKPDEVRKALKPYQPWRGLAIFYLSVHSRFP